MLDLKDFPKFTYFGDDFVVGNSRVRELESDRPIGVKAAKRKRGDDTKLDLLENKLELENRKIALEEKGYRLQELKDIEGLYGAGNPIVKKLKARVEAVLLAELGDN
ncbi:hypothetical protein HDV00_012346 [Rhizophlyctis rosea]|nr:hypothetical protein HDV00_012346 [Rhizophlyctis rosea]